MKLILYFSLGVLQYTKADKLILKCDISVVQHSCIKKYPLVPVVCVV